MRYLVSWVMATLVTGAFVLYGVFTNNASVILNAGIVVVGVQLVVGLRLLRPVHVILLALGAVVHLFGTVPLDGRPVYFQFPYYDVLTHAAGVAVITVAVWGFLQSYTTKNPRSTLALSDRLLVFWAVGIALAFGAGWEIVEFYLPKFVDTQVLFVGGAQDIIEDLISGVLGGIVGGVWIIVTRPAPDYVVLPQPVEEEPALED